MTSSYWTATNLLWLPLVAPMLSLLLPVFFAELQQVLCLDP